MRFMWMMRFQVMRLIMSRGNTLWAMRFVILEVVGAICDDEISVLLERRFCVRTIRFYVGNAISSDVIDSVAEQRASGDAIRNS
jgi:hypothetical protein